MDLTGTSTAPHSSNGATDPAGPTGRLATWLAGTTLEDVPPPVREHAKHLILDGVACALVGAQLPVSRKGVQAITALDDAGTGALIGWGGRATSAQSAAMLNSSFIQGFELDDYHPLAPLHSNALVLPAMLAAVPHAGTVSGEKFLLGAILGYETGPRAGQALGGLHRAGLDLPCAGCDGEVGDRRVIGFTRAMGDDAGKAGRLRHLDRRQRFAERADLVKLDQDRIAGVLADAAFQALGIGHEEIVADKLHACAQLPRQRLPSSPVVLLSLIHI